MAAITPTAGKSHSAGMCWPTDALLAYLCPFYTACVPVLTHTSGLSVSFLHSLCASAVFVLSTQPVCQCCLKSLPTVWLCTTAVCLYQLCVCVCVPIVCVCVYVCQLCVCVNVPVVCACTHIMLTGENVCLRFRQLGVCGCSGPISLCVCESVPIVCV